jgi:hypothetical protein
LRVTAYRRKKLPAARVVVLMPSRAPSGKPRSLLLLAIVAMVLLGAIATVQVASASPTSPIEEVWSFSGGQVAIQAQPGGTFVGTVVAPTSFAECTHPVGEAMWTDITPQPDGSYWGLHQWYFENAGCLRNPTLGKTAWRVLEAANGAHYLLVCFSSPGDPQPTIAPNGVVANVTYGCRESAQIAPVPVQVAPSSKAGVQAFEEAVTLPSVDQGGPKKGSAQKCFSRRVFQIHLRDPKYDPLKEVVVTIRGRRVAVVRRGKVFASTIDLKGLPRGTFTVKIRVTTVLGHHLFGSRTYHTCVKKASKRTRPKGLRP